MRLLRFLRRIPVLGLLGGVLAGSALAAVFSHPIWFLLTVASAICLYAMAYWESGGER